MAFPFANQSDPNCCPSNADTIGQDCATPMFVEVCNLDDMPLGIEASFAPVGCTVDADGLLTGKVFVCKTVDEATEAVTFGLKFIQAGASAVVDYDNAVHGDWGECPVSQSCETVGSKGTLSAWADLSI